MVHDAYFGTTLNGSCALQSVADLRRKDYRRPIRPAAFYLLRAGFSDGPST